MPVYEYECVDCGKSFEIQQKMADAPLTVCPECDGTVKKLMSMSSFQLKGGGWYADGYASANGGAAKPAVPATTAPAAAPACPSGGSCAGCPAAAAS
ncbi:MAG: zinc ribbon domain-containing protein [Desulfoprunum sp.]|nr:zinc ribbon domain-containing protein [Desulfoprunum sp.]